MSLDLNSPIVISKETPTKDLEGALNGIRSKLVDLDAHTRDGLKPEVLEKAARDAEAAVSSANEALKEASAAREIAKLGARTMPVARLAEMTEELRAFPNPKRNEPDAEMAGLFKTESRKAYYNFITADPESVRFALPDDAFVAYQKALRLHDALLIIDQAICASLSRNQSALRQYHEGGGVKSLRMWKEYEALVTPFARAMTTTGAGTGLEWVPTGYGGTMVEDIRQPISVTGQFETVNMPQDPYKWFIQGLAKKSKRVSQGVAITQQDISTLNVTFTTDKHGTLILTSSELEEDSYLPLVANVKSEAAWLMAAGLADAIINGQNTATIDTANAPAASDTRGSYNGIRYWGNAIAANTRINSGGAVSADTLAMLKGVMGRFGNMPDRNFWLTGYIGYAKLLTLRDASGWAVVLTQDKAGSGNTWDSGLLGRMYGSPLIVENDYPENQDASGLVTNLGGTQTSIHLVNRKGFRVGIRRGVTIEASRDWAFNTDQIAFRVLGRFDFRAMQSPSSVYKYVGSVVNINGN